MPRTSAVNMKCPRSEHAGSRVKLTVLTENPATDDSAIRACQEGAESRTCSPSFCRGRSPGTARANTASGSSSDAKDPRRLRDSPGNELVVARGLGSFASLELPLAVFARAVPGLLPRQKLGEHVRLSAPSWQARIALSSVAGFSVSTVSFTREPACSDLGHFIFAALVLGIRRVSHIGRTD